MPIDIGYGAVDGTSTHPADYTVADVWNTANATGVLDTIEIWANTNMTGCKVGTFEYEGNLQLNCHDYETLGNVTAGSKQTFTGLSINVIFGYYIGYYAATGAIERSDPGGGIYSLAGDQTATGTQTYTWYTGLDVSLYGTGGIRFGTVSIGVGASVTTSAKKYQIAIASIAAAATVAADAFKVRSAVAAIEVALSLSVTGEFAIKYGIAAIQAAASLAISPLRIRPAVAALDVIASLAASAEVWVPATASITAAASASVLPFRIAGGKADIAVSASIAALAALIASGEVSIEAAASLCVEIIHVEQAELLIAVAVVVSASAIFIVEATVTITASTALEASALAYIYRQFTYGGTLEPGDIVEIDIDKRTVKLNGVNDRANFSGDFFKFFLGDNVLAWDDDEGSREIDFRSVHKPRYL